MERRWAVGGERRERRAMEQLLLAEIMEIQKMPLAKLRERWRQLFDGEPPRYGRRFMAERLIYRLQELQQGGLSEKAQQKMKEVLAKAELGDLGGRGATRKPKGKAKPSLLAGTKLVKEWHGQRHEVMVLPKGFEYQGRTCRSLSAIAHEITGSHWNGRAFFSVGAKKNG